MKYSQLMLCPAAPTYGVINNKFFDEPPTSNFQLKITNTNIYQPGDFHKIFILATPRITRCELLSTRPDKYLEKLLKPKWNLRTCQQCQFY